VNLLTSRKRRLLTSAGLLSIVTAVALIAVPAAFNSGTSSRLAAFVTVNNRGPIPGCTDTTGATCSPANTVWSLIHVVNLNPLPNWSDGASTRDALQNAFVASSVELRTSIDGARSQRLPTSPGPRRQT
jgi:hypothetical protein